jgi:hypothetical protein
MRPPPTLQELEDGGTVKVYRKQDYPVQGRSIRRKEIEDCSYPIEWRKHCMPKYGTRAFVKVAVDDTWTIIEPEESAIVYIGEPDSLKPAKEGT